MFSAPAHTRRRQNDRTAEQWLLHSRWPGPYALETSKASKGSAQVDIYASRF